MMSPQMIAIRDRPVLLLKRAKKKLIKTTKNNYSAKYKYVSTYIYSYKIQSVF